MDKEKTLQIQIKLWHDNLYNVINIYIYLCVFFIYNDIMFRHEKILIFVNDSDIQVRFLS